jgi:hypothetical protein
LNGLEVTRAMKENDKVRAQIKSLEQEVRAATDDQVNASRLRVRTKLNEIDGDLNKFTLAEHLTIVNMLGTMVQHRQQVLSQEAAEMQRQHQMKAHQEQLAKQAEQQERADKARANMEARAAVKAPCANCGHDTPHMDPTVQENCQRMWHNKTLRETSEPVPASA